MCICLVWFKTCHLCAISSASIEFWYQYICLLKLLVTSWKWITYTIYDVTMKMISFNAFLENFKYKFTDKSVTCIIIWLHLWRNKHCNIVHKIVISLANPHTAHIINWISWPKKYLTPLLLVQWKCINILG